MEAYVLIKIHTGEVHQVVRQLRRIEGVSKANMTFGPFDAVAIVEASDVAQLGKILTMGIQPIPGITETLTCLGVEID